MTSDKKNPKKNTMKKPTLLTIDTIYHYLSADERAEAQFSLNQGFAVARSVSGVFRLVEQMGEPYLIEDYRIGCVRRGRLRAVVNLQEQTFDEGTVVFITPGTVVEPIEASPDLCVEGMSLTVEQFHLAHAGRLPELFRGKMRDGHCPASPEERRLLDAFFSLLCTLANPAGGVAPVVVAGVVTAVTHYVDQLFRAQGTDRPSSGRSAALFNRFVREVNLHCREERSLAFYAGRLCVTEHYLSGVVSRTSGVKAKEWIDRAVVTVAKVMLRHTDRQVSQIADDLHFATPSFFCKYFRRLAGCTPAEYRGRG